MQPVALATVHVEPVNPLIHRQAQLSEERKVLPPFWQAVVVFCWHVWRGVSLPAVVDFALWTTKSSIGTTTAVAMTIRSIRKRRRNPQHGRPQQRRPCLFWLCVHCKSCRPWISREYTADGHGESVTEVSRLLE